MKFNRIGLYFGSFNPIHKGHLYVIKTALKTAIDKLYLVVSPQSPFKSLSELAPFHDRLEMTRITIKESGLEDRVEAVDWEEHMFPSYTAETLQKAIPILKENDTTIFMGLDNFLTIDKWREPKYILENYGIYIIPRGDINFTEIVSKKVKELKETITPQLKSISYSNPFAKFNMAATDIRNKILNGEDTDEMICKGVLDYIKKEELYGVKGEKRSDNTRTSCSMVSKRMEI